SDERLGAGCVGQPELDLGGDGEGDHGRVEASTPQRLPWPHVHTVGVPVSPGHRAGRRAEYDPGRIAVLPGQRRPTGTTARWNDAVRRPARRPEGRASLAS